MLMSLWPYTQHELFWFARRRLVTHLRAVSSGLIWALFAKKGLMPTLCQFKFHPQWFQGLIIEVNNELSFGLGCWVSACVCFECAHVPVPSIVTSSDGEARGGGQVTQLLCQLPVTECHPNQIDSGKHTATGPKFPIPFPAIHQSVCVNVFSPVFAASLYFTVIFSLSVSLAHINRCKSL